MNPKLARRLVSLYPDRWKQRYGEEFEALLRSGPGDIRTTANIVWSAFRERILPTQGPEGNQPSLSFSSITKQPSAFLPLWMSLTALALVLGHVAGDVIQSGHILREADEGADAHIWQILMATQIPILAFFAVKWLPRAPRQTLKVLALQAGAVLANLAAVFFLGLG